MRSLARTAGCDSSWALTKALIARCRRHPIGSRSRSAGPISWSAGPPVTERQYRPRCRSECQDELDRNWVRHKIWSPPGAGRVGAALYLARTMIGPTYQKKQGGFEAALLGGP